MFQGSVRVFYRHEQSARKGEAWAIDKISELIETGANLPNIGKGYSKIKRAAYLVNRIARERLRSPLLDHEKVFWTSVSDEASSIYSSVGK